MKRKISISTGYFQRTYGDIKALDIAKELGVDAIDFNTEGNDWDYRNPASIYSKSDDEICEYFRGIRRHADELGIEIGQTHGRITGFKNIFEEDEALVKNARLDCMAAGILGAKAVIIHSVTTLYLGPDADPKLFRDLNFEMYDRLIPFAKQYGTKLAFETFGDAVKYGVCDFFGDIDEFIKSYNRVCGKGDNADYMTCCVDTGHSNKATRFNNNPSPADVIRLLGRNVTTLHLHDNDTFTDQHKPPMTGSIDWYDVLCALDEIGYDGNYNLELALGCFGKGLEFETAEFGIKIMRNLLR